MNNHPLQFFKDIVESPYGIKMIESNFYRIPLTQEEEEEHTFSWPFEINREEGYAIFQNPLDGPPTYKIYFKDKLESLCNNKKRGFINDLDTYLLKENEQKIANDYLQKILFEVNYLISVYKGNEYLERYPIILETIKSIKTHLHSKYGLPDNNVPPSIKKGNNAKIQWLGKTNVLTTLFYDLLNGQDKGEPYIHANKKDVMQFLIDNFLDKNGDELSESTVQSYFDKPDKKAKIGDRIELPNKRVIK